MKRISALLLSVFLTLACLCSCSKNSERIERYNLADLSFANITVSHYEYSYIEFNYDNSTYYIENKTKLNNIISSQKGSFSIDENNKVTITNTDIPTQNYLLYPDEELYFESDSFYVEAYIEGYGEIYMIFSK